MADGEVKYSVRVDDGRVDSDLDQANSKVEKGTGKLKGIAKGAGIAIGASFLAAGTAAIGIGTAAVLSANDMDKAMNGFIASTGKGVEEAGRYQDVLESIYANNYGEDFEDIANSMALVTQQMGDMDDASLQKITESAYLLRDTFEIEISESLLGANALMNQFGLDGEKAYNLIAQGAQAGLNQNQDLADQLAEYSVYYSDMGFSAEEMFNAMANGVESGAYQIDYLNDAMKEFGIRSKDGSKASMEAFDALGLNADKLTKKFANGGEGAREAFAQVSDALMGVDDQVLQNQIGVALFGTKWEDLGIDAIEALTNTNGAIDSTKDKLGEMENIKYDSLGEMFEGLKRAVELLLIPLGEMLIPLLKEIIEAVMPQLEEILPSVVDALSQFLPPLMELVEALLPVLIELFNTLIPPLLELIEAVLPIVISLFEELIPPIMELINAVLPPLISIIKAILPVLMVLLSTFTSVFSGIVKNVTAQINRIISIFKNILNFVKNVFTGNWRGAWQNIKNIFSNIMSGIGSMFKSPINRIIDGINGFTRGLSKIKIPDWVPGVGGKGFSIPKIPRLKVGMDYVPSDYFPAYLDEGEAVLPKEEAEVYRKLGGNLEGLLSMPSLSSQSGYYYNSSVTTNDFNGLFEGANFYVRDDQDITKIARELNDLIKSTARGKGVKL